METTPEAEQITTAAMNGDILLINLLWQRGAQVNPRIAGKTPLALALEAKQGAAAELLRQYGAGVSQVLG